MAWPIRSLVLYLGLPVLSVCALTFFLWKRKEEEEWRALVRDLNLSEREIRIPQKVLPILIGPNRNKLQELQENTNTNICFHDGGEPSDYTICKITGKKDNVTKAIQLVLDTINNCEQLKTFNMYIPAKCYSRIIGRCGDTIRSIAKSSGAKVNIDKSVQELRKCKVVIEGTDEQIKLAISLIEEKVREEDLASNKWNTQSLIAYSSNGEVAAQKKEYERLIATTGESMLQVYISSINTPVHFWLQLISPRAADLDQLVEEMTEYYKKDKNRIPLEIYQISKGLIVACLMGDSKWYRVEIYGYDEPTDPIENTQVDVFYVDYGESEFVSLKNLSHLPNSFLSLRFQAIESRMVGIEPIENGKWTDATIDRFADLSHCGEWKALTAEIIGYEKRNNADTQVGNPIPLVKLYDPEGAPGVDLGTQLVQQGLAKATPSNKFKPKYDIVEEDSNDEDW